MPITAAAVKALREKTGQGMMKCKEALKACDGDEEKAVDYLRKLGLNTADKKSSRATKQGAIGHYIHGDGKIGVLVEIACESDFVAKGDDFRALLKDVCMQVAAADPIAVRPEELSAEVVEKEREIYRELMKDKPANIIDKIVDGKLNAFYKERCLMQQQFVKDSSQSIADVINAAIAKLGENITIRRFCRMELGGE